MQKKNFLCIGIAPYYIPDTDIVKDMKEVKSLVEAYGGEVKEFVVQRREEHSKGLFIGRGKIDEVTQLVKEHEIDVVVLNASVKPGHVFIMKNKLNKANPALEVWDRVDLILHIFAAHANTAEAKLQIELASMRHMGPRIYGMGLVMSRQAGGIGTLGVGETNTELMKRHWATQMKKVDDKLKKLTIDRVRQLDRRVKNGMKTVSIIGYTNAGKTSLYNTLTGKKNVSDNALFVTLDSSVGKVYLAQSQQEILVSDTIGFISNLPASLVDAFKSTLMESIHADLLLFVIDSADEDMQKKIHVVENVLLDLKIQNKKRIYVFNKIDLADNDLKDKILYEYHDFTPQFISAKEGTGIDSLLSLIENKLFIEEETKPRKKRVHI